MNEFPRKMERDQNTPGIGSNVEPSNTTVSTLRGFLDLVDTISTKDVKIEPQYSIRSDGTRMNLLNLMEKQTTEKPLIVYNDAPETADLEEENNEKINWKLNDKNENLYRCAVCQVEFSTRISLDRHVVDLHLGKTGRFQCDICHKEFTRLSDLARHKLIHSGVKPFHCNTCQKQFTRQDHLKQHILSHSQCSDGEFFAFENGLNRCTICQKQLSRPQHLRTHMRQHLGTLFECEKCNKRFSRASHLRAHMRLHLGTCFRCDICRKEFSRPSDLDRHKLTHLDKKLFDCPTCRKKFSRKDNLKKHMLSHVESVPANKNRGAQTEFDFNDLCLNSGRNCSEGHTITQDTNCHDCHICRKHFTRRDHLIRHLGSHKERPESNSFDRDPAENNVEFDTKFHFDGNVCSLDWPAKKFECALCEKRFNRKVRLKEHVRTHGEGDYATNNGYKDENRCNICHKQLSRPEHLKAHMRLHLGTLFKCEICQKEFSRLSDLDRHKLVHSGLKQFICIICLKQFSRKDYLKNHMLSHANQKSFECDKCKKRFTYFTNLRNHLHIHLGD